MDLFSNSDPFLSLDIFAVGALGRSLRSYHTPELLARVEAFCDEELRRIVHHVAMRANDIEGRLGTLIDELSVASDERAKEIAWCVCTSRNELEDFCEVLRLHGSFDEDIKLLVSPCDRFGRTLLSSFDLAGDFYDEELFQAAYLAGFPGIWWGPNVSPLF